MLFTISSKLPPRQGAQNKKHTMRERSMGVGGICGRYVKRAHVVCRCLSSREQYFLLSRDSDHLSSHRIYVLLLGAAAITASAFCLQSCQFFSYQSLDGLPWAGLEPPFDTLAGASVGLFSYSSVTTGIAEHKKETDELLLFGQECSGYDNWENVGQTRFFYVAQWSAIIAPIFAFLAWSQTLLEMCCCRLKGGLYWVYFFYFVAFCFQACTFLVFFDTQFW